MAIYLRTGETRLGFRGIIVCVLRGQRLWSESHGLIRATREAALEDARWLCEQHEKSWPHLVVEPTNNTQTHGE